MSALEMLIINLDGRGYLPDAAKLARAWPGERADFEAAFAALRSLEPAGVGAADLSDCLCIQLERMGESGSLAYAICEGFLEHLGKNHYNHIAKALNATEKEIASAKELIASLEPIPSNGYDDSSGTAWIVPDVEIVCEDGQMSVISCDSFMPSYTLDPEYMSISESGVLSDADREYFRQKLSEAQWALSCVGRRRDTLLRCAAEIAEQQREFFEDSSCPIRPCSMTDIAARMGVHPSTVSRTVKDKYIICDRGLFPMSKFFASEVCGGTAEEITQLIKRIIDREDPEKPLSDSEICKKLAARGCAIARRTVAKYRELAMIPPATGRKKRT